MGCGSSSPNNVNNSISGASLQLCPVNEEFKTLVRESWEIIPDKDVAIEQIFFAIFDLEPNIKSCFLIFPDVQLEVQPLFQAHKKQLRRFLDGVTLLLERDWEKCWSTARKVAARHSNAFVAYLEANDLSQIDSKPIFEKIMEVAADVIVSNANVSNPKTSDRIGMAWKTFLDAVMKEIWIWLTSPPQGNFLSKRESTLSIFSIAGFDDGLMHQLLGKKIDHV